MLRLRRDLAVRLLCALTSVLCVSVSKLARSQAATPRVLLVYGKHVGGEARAAIESGLASEAEVLDSERYARLSRAQGLLPYSEAAIERVAPRMHAELIVVARRSGAKLQLTYRNGETAEVLSQLSFPARRRGSAAARTRSRIAAGVREALAQRAPKSAASDDRTLAPDALAQDEAAEPPEPIEPDSDSEPEPEPEPDSFIFDLSAGLGAATRTAVVPTRLGVHELDTGLFAGVSLGLGMTAPFGSHLFVRATADYRSSLGLQGSEQMPRPTEMSTALRSHALGFGVAPGYRFGGAGGVSVLAHVGWYFRGLRPIAQLALPELSWHAAVFRPELHLPLANGLVTLRFAPELQVIAGLYTTLPDESGLAHTGMAFGGEVSVDVRLAAAFGLRIEYRQSHASFRTAWAQPLRDVERFAALRVVLSY